MWVLGILRLVNCSIEFSCMVPLTPAVIVMRRLVSHLFFFVAWLLVGRIWCVYVYGIVRGIYSGSL